MIVVGNGQPEGIVAERDLLEKVLERFMDPGKLKVSNIMTKNLVLRKPNSETHEVAKLMFKRKIKKFPIVGAESLLDWPP